MENKFEDLVKEATKNLNQNLTINKMQNIRASNNDNWMDLLRIALEYAPKETKQILKRITNCDKKISKLCDKIINEKN